MPVELNAESLLHGDPTPSRVAQLRRHVFDTGIVLVAFAAAGALCGLIWKSLWHPPPGVAYNHLWYLRAEGLPDDFSATGLYVVVAVVGGLLVAGAVALVVERDEVVTTVAVVVGSVVAAWLMYVVGHRLGPPDPHVLAQTAENLDPIPSDLTVAGHGPTISISWLRIHWRLPGSPFLAFPLGSVIGLAVVYFGFGQRGSNAPGRAVA